MKPPLWIGWKIAYGRRVLVAEFKTFWREATQRDLDAYGAASRRKRPPVVHHRKQRRTP